MLPGKLHSAASELLFIFGVWIRLRRRRMSLNYIKKRDPKLENQKGGAAPPHSHSLGHADKGT